jgi:poly(3-hydroxybutyrate) depolymerase
MCQGGHAKEPAMRSDTSTHDDKPRRSPTTWIRAAVLASIALGCTEEASPSTTMCPAGMVASGASCVVASPMQAGTMGGAGGLAGTTAGTTAGTSAGMTAGMIAGMDATAGATAGTTAPGTGGMMAGMQAGVGAPMVDSGVPPGMGSSGCGVSDVPTDGMQTIDVDGLQRQFIVAVPDGYDANTPHKLVFAWHGLGGTAQQIAGGAFGRGGFYGLESQAAGTTIFVAGQGLDTSNQVGSGPGWDNMGGRDVAFARAMLEWLRTSYCIDQTRIFSTGMSYGGIMSNTIGCALGDELRAIAPMAGLGPSAFGGGGTCVGQVAVWLSHGNMDTVVTFASGQQSRDRWVTSNHCDSTTAAADANGCVEYEGCDDGFPVVWCEFDGGHTVPIFASTEIWKFFSRF